MLVHTSEAVRRWAIVLGNLRNEKLENSQNARVRLENAQTWKKARENRSHVVVEWKNSETKNCKSLKTTTLEINENDLKVAET